MTINRYRANNLKSAMDKAFSEMGPDAKILQVRQLDKYNDEFNGQLSERVEIIAVMDGDPKKSEQNESKYQEPNKNLKNTRRHSIDMLVEDDYDLIPNTPLVPPSNGRTESYSQKTEKNQTKEYKTLYEALNIRSNSSSPDIEQSTRSYEKPVAKQKFFTEKQELSGTSKSRLSQILHECLTRNQVNSELAYEILSLLNDEAFTIKGEEKDLSARNYLSSYMKQKINVSKGLDTSKKVTILIGPTGVGKTTTLAKLAAQYQFHKNKNVGLITVDAYRIAAIDQLKTYAQIMSMPLKVALTPEQLWKCIDEYSDMDLVLVDTPGRSHLNKSDIRTIEEFLEAAQPADTHLLLSASTKDNDAYTVVESFAPDYVQKFLFTKLDETTSFGSIMNVCTKLKKPISYLTMGQNVPDDIRVADIDFLVDLFITKNRLFREL